MSFAHLHLHTHASLLDASCKPDALASKAKELGITALAMTDHANVFNAVPFVMACEKEGIKPIIGSEFNFVEDCAESKSIRDRQSTHIILLAENNTGLQNIIKLVSASNSEENYYYKPRIDFNMLKEHSEGVIVLTACIGGVVATHLYDKRDDYDGEILERRSSFRGKAVVRRFLEVFDKDHFYLEIQDNGTQEAADVREEMRKIADTYGLRTVATADVHYVNQDDHESHRVLVDMARYGRSSGNTFDGKDCFYLKSEAEMLELDFTEDEVSLTGEIAERCSVDLELDRHRLPKYSHLPEGVDAKEHLRNLVREGAVALGLDKKSNADEYRDRMSRELGDIELMGFEDYFLIVHDVVSWARSQNILIGCGRGSAGGSLVSYTLGITGIDPLEYGLIWERFLNVGRKSLPDIDTDVPRSKRGQVLEYIRDRFGSANVAQLVTFNQLAARAVLKDVFRVFDMPFDEANAITRLVPEKGEDHGKITLEEALRSSAPLREYADRYKAYFSIAASLEGCFKSLGTHAAAVVIADHPFSDGEYPLCRSKDGSLMMGWDMDVVDKLGLLKLDILGLNTLDVIQDTIDLVKERHGVSLDMSTIPLDDPATYMLLGDGKTVGVFQLEKQLGKTWSKQLQPETVEHISDLVSIIRPGPLESGMHETYRGTKRGDSIPQYPSQRLKPLLDPTYGALLYQEQVIFICQDLAGMDAKDADSVRKAMGKKKPEEMAKWEERFLDGCTNHGGLARSEAAEIWGWIEKFAGYGFNKSHGVGYALLAYYTAYLKANYTVEFFCANLRSAMFAQDTAEEINKFINDAKLFDIRVTPPQVRKVNREFDVVDDNTIAFGLSAMKGVGERMLGPLERTIADKSFDMFLASAHMEKVNKRVMDAAIKSGALDYLGEARSQMLAKYALFSSLTAGELKVMGAMVKHADWKGSNGWVGRIRLMADDDNIEALKEALEGVRMPTSRRRPKLREILSQFDTADPFDSTAQNLAWEEHFLGIALSDDETSSFKARNTCKDIIDFGGPDMPVEVAIKLERIKMTKTRRDQQDMAFLTGTDATGQVDNFVVFPQAYERFKLILEEGNILRLRGTISDRGGVVVNQLERLK